MPIASPLFCRSLLMDKNGNYYTAIVISYPPHKAKLEWDIATDNNFLSYYLYRENSLLTTIKDSSVNTYTDSSSPDTKYHYTIATQVRTGLSKSDTLTANRFQSATGSFYGNNTLMLSCNGKIKVDIPQVILRFLRMMY